MKCEPFNAENTLESFNYKTFACTEEDFDNVNKCYLAKLTGDYFQAQACINEELIKQLDVENDTIQADWLQTDSTLPDYIKNKPDLYGKDELNDLLSKKGEVKSVNYVTPDETGNVAITSDTYAKDEIDSMLQDKISQETFNNILSSKADVSHTHVISDIVNLQGELDSKGTVKSVNNVAPDSNGNVTIESGNMNELKDYVDSQLENIYTKSITVTDVSGSTIIKGAGDKLTVNGGIDVGNAGEAGRLFLAQNVTYNDTDYAGIQAWNSNSAVFFLPNDVGFRYRPSGGERKTVLLSQIVEKLNL